jgi:mycothiol synthase
MLTIETAVEEFDAQTATEAEWQALNTFQNRLLAERLPDDPPRPLAQTKALIQNMPPFIEIHMWLIWNDAHSAVLARATLILMLTEENRHLAQFELGVLPEERRHGLGTRLLARLAATTRAAHRTLLVTGTHGNVPAGEAVMTHLGATPGLATHVNQLDLTTLDPALLQDWRQRAAARNPDFTLGVWQGPYPDADLAAMVELTEAANGAPRGDLAFEDFHWTAEHLRQQEAMLWQSEIERWTMTLRETATGVFAGYTEVMWNPDQPTLLEQGFTAVWPRYRHQGLGRWLKAAMLEKVLHDWPQVRYVRTGNADSNAAMLAINEDLGFRPHLAETLWQVDLARVEAYLAER